jgi:1-phosphofructokinase family hexose kinase
MIYTVTLNPALDRELTVPEITFDKVLRATETRLDWGGKGFNVSRMLAVLEVKSIALGFAGGHTGEALREGLISLGIATDFVNIVGETRTNVSIVAPNGKHHLKVNETGPLISQDEQQALMLKVRKLAQPGDWWVLAGSLPPGVAPTFYAELISEIKRAGGRVLLDTSDAPLRYGCETQPYLVKPNAFELNQLTGLPVNSPIEALRAASILKGIEYVVVSMGKDGALLVNQGQGWFATTTAIQERNPIGAGDSLVAGLVWGLSQGDALAALRYGVACGAATASHSGTGLGTYTEITALVEQVQLQAIGL